MSVSLVCNDVIAWAEKTPPFGAHALVCDPPYHLSGGFMGATWDRDGPDAIAYRPATWKALAQHLLPGAFVMAFASSRGWHRLACALEDAGLIIHPSIFGWGFGSGFPKATRIDDGSFSGHRYGLQSLKPALEPIIVAQVPYQGKPIDSITTTGAGAWWIEGGRIGTQTETHASKPRHERTTFIKGFTEGTETISHDHGRWPPHFALVHSPQCERIGTREVKANERPNCAGKVYDQVSGDVYGSYHPAPYKTGKADANGLETVPAYRCSERCPIRLLDEQAGYRDAGGQSHKLRSTPKTQDIYGQYRRSGETATYHDSGAASRFFFTVDWSLDVAEQLATAAPVFYAAKASRAERDHGLEGMPLQARTEYEGRNPHLNGQYRIEHGQITGRKADSSQARNPHPTVKPIALTRWLATLLLPPAAYAPRRLLVPFCGTGSEMIGAMMAGWDTVLGIEQEASYVTLARQRLAWWTGYHVPSVPEPVLAPQETPRPVVARQPGQLSLF